MLSSRAALSRALQSTRAFSSFKPAVLPDLPYAYDALEPAIPAAIMELHHQKHHATYVANLNAALAKEEALLKANDSKGLIANAAAIKFNGGGHINHSIFWENLSPNGGGKPTGKLAAAIDARFGSFESFQEQMNGVCLGIQGSGWGWLVHTGTSLEIVACANQDPVLIGTPLLGFDMWEHAFYLKYKNVKPEYLKNLWTVVNFDDVAKRFEAAA